MNIITSDMISPVFEELFNADKITFLKFFKKYSLKLNNCVIDPLVLHNIDFYINDSNHFINPLITPLCNIDDLTVEKIGFNKVLYDKKKGFFINFP